MPSKFVVAAPVARPKGAYVTHGGRTYPADHGYPAQVVIDHAGQPGQLVLIAAPGGVILGFAGAPERVRFLSRSDDSVWQRTLARASILSTGPVLGIGDTGLPAQLIDPATLSLPIVASKKAALRTIARGTGAIVLVALATTGSHFYAAHRLSSANVAMTAADELRISVNKDVTALEKQIAALPTVANRDSNTSPDLPKTALQLTGVNKMIRIKEGRGYAS